jgi:hypothetical protein
MVNRFGVEDSNVRCRSFRAQAAFSAAADAEPSVDPQRKTPRSLRGVSLNAGCGAPFQGSSKPSGMMISRPATWSLGFKSFSSII